MRAEVIKRLSTLCLVLLPFAILTASCSNSTNASPPGKEEQPVFPVTIDLLGSKHEALIDSQGSLENDIQITSADGSVSLSIKKGTRLLDRDGKPLQEMRLAISQSLPLPPENSYIVSAVSELEPNGATAEPMLLLTLSYNAHEIPQDIRETAVFISPYDENSGWGSFYYKNVDAENNQVTTQVNQFAKYAVLAPMVPAPVTSLTSIPLEKALASGLPTLADFGWRTCIPCNEMKPILEELAVEYEGKLNVVIVEVYEQEELASQHGIISIPTQIFFDRNGREIARNPGFMSKERIVVQLSSMGIYK